MGDVVIGTLWIATLAIFAALLQGCVPLDVESRSFLNSASLETMPSATVLELAGLIRELRAAGFTCPGGRTFSPNEASLEFDCGLWRLAQQRAEALVNRSDLFVRRDAFRATSDVRSVLNDLQTGKLVGQHMLSFHNAGSAELALEEFKSSDADCISIMDPSATRFGLGHLHSPEAYIQERWTHVFTTAGSVKAACLESQPTTRGVSAANLGGFERGAGVRMLKPSGGDGEAADTATQPPLPTPDPYRGPGQTFGVVLLSIAITVFFVCTFGSIFLGNLWLSLKQQEQVQLNDGIVGDDHSP
mmetsp:Transcript_8304/g.21030  ORF Transcript_8304/g.21030 Transcript_8304/m.21030 type:complete len:302 (-) Transcript_8304:92-997(-)|eukprot:CAMPEP_0117538528 /NCGR_PEP_ID=MMETSP0784-20121206/42524_1 /TAXON_ID=39447 /ORGANISM="" /LENGTH=301 /DNA_ID=CAMNT_0005335143 /DNA_START=69 /DNA_END=974 /DNA_ORIENTATION=+